MADKRGSETFLRHTTIYAIGNIARRLVGFAMLPVYTRFLTAADYGAIGLLTFALALFEPLFGARLGVALPKFYFESPNDREKRAVVWSTLGLTGVVSALSMLVLIVFRGFGSEVIFGDRKYAVALGIFAVNLLSRPFEDTGMLYLRMHERSSLFLVVSMLKLLLQVALNVLLVVYWQEGVIGVVLSGVISSVAVGLCLTFYVRAQEKPAFSLEISQKMFEYCWPLWFSGLAGLYVGSSGGMYLRALGTLSDVGRLELALKFATVVGMVIWMPFYQHWGPLSYRHFKETDGARKFQLAFIGIAVLMFSGGLGISIFSAPIIRVMSTKQFFSAAALVPILTFGFIINYLRSFFNFCFLATEKTKISSLCQYATAIIITIAYFLLIPRFGLIGAAVAQCVAFVGSFLYTWTISRRYYDPGFHVKTVGILAFVFFVAYVSSNVVLRSESIAGDLVMKFAVWSVAAATMAFIGGRKMLRIDSSLSEKLPWPLDRLSRIA